MVDRRPLDRRLTLELDSEVDEERRDRLEVLDARMLSILRIAMAKNTA